MNILGIDIGGTKTAVCIGTPQGDILAHGRMASTGHASADAYGQALHTLCKEVLGHAGFAPRDLDAVGISAPGPLNVSKGVFLTPPNLPLLHHWPVAAEVRRMLDRPVYLNNDGNAAALAEYVFGEFRRTPDLVYCTFSTGMGGGIIAGGRLVQGASDGGGEIGHHIIDPHGPVCGCGLYGCWEAFVAGIHVARAVQEQVRAGAATSMLEKVGGEVGKIDMAVILAAAREGDALAVRVWDELMERMAQGVGNLIMILNPQVIILGTIAVHAGEFALGPIRARLPKYTWPSSREACQVVASSLGARISDLAAVAVAAVEINGAA